MTTCGGKQKQLEMAADVQDAAKTQEKREGTCYGSTGDKDSAGYSFSHGRCTLQRKTKDY